MFQKFWSQGVWLVIFFGNSCYCFLNIEELNEVRYGVDIWKEPVNEEEVNLSEGLKLASKHGQMYYCKLPGKARQMADQADPQEMRLPVDYPVQLLLQPLRKEACMVKVKGWWTYELCFGDSIQQYHSEADAEHSTDVITLGKFDSDFDWSDKDKIKASPFKRHKVQKYHSQTYVNGTQCDILNHRRDTEVRYYCDESATTAYIDRVDEPSTCSYIITVKTHLICSHPHTRLVPSYQAVNVVCQPMLPVTMYNHYVEQKEKREKLAYEKQAEALRKKRDDLKTLLQDLKEQMLPQSSNNGFPKVLDPFNPRSKFLTKLFGRARDKEEAEDSSKETALELIGRFVEEKRLKRLSMDVQKRLVKVVTSTVKRFSDYPTADMARIVKFEIENFVTMQESLSEEFLMRTFQALSMSAANDRDRQATEKTTPPGGSENVEVKVKQIDAEIGEVNEENEQDPSLQQLEEEIGEELKNAGFVSTSRIEVHLITTKRAGESFSLTEDQAKQFKDMLIEIVGGVSLEDKEKERSNRLTSNYNMIFTHDDGQFVSTLPETEEKSSTKS